MILLKRSNAYLEVLFLLFCYSALPCAKCFSPKSGALCHVTTNMYFIFSPFAGHRSRIDVGVIDGEKEEAHYFINVADIHL